MTSRQHTPAEVAFRRPWPTTRRGLKLWLIAIVLGLKGLGYVLGSVPPTTEYAVRVLTGGQVPLGWWGWHLMIPLWVVSWSLLLACVFAAFTAYCHVGRDRWGYTVLQAFCSLWTVLYLVAIFYFGAPSEVGQGALTWVTIGAVLAACAGDPPGLCTLDEDSSLLPWRPREVMSVLPVPLLVVWAIDSTWLAGAALSIVLAVIAIGPAIYTTRTSRRADKRAEALQQKVDANDRATASRADLQAASREWQRLYEAEGRETSRLRREVADLLEQVGELRSEVARLQAAQA